MRSKGMARTAQTCAHYCTLVSTWLERSFFISNSLFSVSMASLLAIIASLFFSSSSKASIASFRLKTFSTSLSSHCRRCSSFACSSLKKITTLTCFDPES